MVAGTVEEWLKIWVHLGFVVVLTVPKSREVYEFEHAGRLLTITLDQVDSLGAFSEISGSSAIRPKLNKRKPTFKKSPGSCN